MALSIMALSCHSTYPKVNMLTVHDIPVWSRGGGCYSVNMGQAKHALTIDGLSGGHQCLRRENDDRCSAEAFLVTSVLQMMST
jgi:hypothetical protein